MLLCVYIRVCLEVVRKSGSICKCYDDFFEDIQVSDELRKVCLVVECTRDCLYIVLCDAL